MAGTVDVRWILNNRSDETCQTDYGLNVGTVGLAALFTDILGFQEEEEAIDFMVREYARQWLDEMRLRE